MRESTRKKFDTLCSRMAATYGVPSVRQQFSVSPTIEQRLQDAIVERSTFLPKINTIPVDDLEGETLLGSATGPVSGRTDTSADKERTPRNVLGLKPYRYKLVQTNTDVYLRYATMDAWSKFPDMGDRYSRYVQERMANDRELVGWHGRSAAADTDLEAFPLMQDVNKGWMQYMRENLPGNILSGGETAGEIRIGAGGDWANLDIAVHDLLQGIPTYMRQNLVALIGTDLIAQEKAALFAVVGGKPTEKALLGNALTTFGGLAWDTPSNFPGRGLVVTSYDNLSVYLQNGSWRRKVEDNPKKDRVEDYNSRNEGYVVETPERFVAVEFDNVKLPDGASGWA